MVPYLPSTVYFDDGSLVLWEDGERIFRRDARLDVNGKKRAILSVQPGSERPSRSILDRLAHEYELRDELDGAWAARPLDLVRDAGRTVLVLEDVDGEPLDRLLGAPMEVGRFLGLAIAIVAAVGKLHQRSLVHKDIKPANILVSRATGEVRLTGFGIASRLARERQSPHPPETIAGTLAYMAPEQTGRMNRSIDSRSDLYAIGVSFYQMLTGALPFTAADPMEWVHCHLARRPVAPAERRRDIPDVISAIVMKLLAKMAEDRYQTATGLDSDLRRCQTEWSGLNRVDYFTLGERDTPNRLLIPEKLYGREREVGTLLAAFDRVVKAGTPELVLVSGYSGIGKSSVVNELQPVLVPPRGLFAAGKFDQYKRDVPYYTLAQAFRSLVRPLLAKTEVELAVWREALREALGPNGQLMVDLVPELKLVIGEQSPVPALPPQDSQRRFQLVFRRFLAAFAQPEHPLALFLDDLQWLDAATLDLLEDLLIHPDVRHVLLIGAYRDNELTATHPLNHKLDAVRASGRVRDIKLSPLTAENLSGLVVDSLRIGAQQAAPLADLVRAKTDGNPFFVIQFLHVIADEGLLAFDHGQARWSFDIAGIHAKQYTDNVVELLAGRLTRLPLDTQDALRQLACLGNVADAAMLSIVLGITEQELHAVLWEGLRQQLIERQDRFYKFTHDRVQEAAYALIPEESRAQVHLAIGRLLVMHTPPENRDEAIFEIVNQLNRGAPLIASVAEREQLAELNLAAGKRAKASSAYASALTYLSSGATVLPTDAWNRRQELAFELALHPADCEMCMGLLQAAEERLAALAPHAVDTVQRCAVGRRRVELYTMIGVAERALAVGLECLRHVGIDWPAHPTKAEALAEYERIWSRLGSRAIEDCADLPLMHDAESLATLDLLTVMTIPAMYTDENLHALDVCRAVNLSLERGNSDAAPVSYASLGLIAGPRFGQHDRGYRLGKMACELIERYGLKHFGGRTYFNFAVLIPWTRPFRDGIDPTRRAFQMSKDHGQPTFAAHAGRGLASLLLAVGHPLDQLEREAERALEFMQPFGFFLDRISQPLALVRMLRGKTSSFGSLDDGRFREQFFEERTTGLPPFAMLECFYWIRKLQARFFAGDHAAAVEAAERAERWYATSAAPALFLTEMADWGFYAALARAARCEPMGPDPYARHREALRRHERQLRDWAASCPQNFEDRVALIGAEIARIEGRELEAERLYEAAIKSARENEFVHNEALANELAARFHAARRFETIANAYLREARSCYLRWGAYGKVRQLEALHPVLRQPEAARAAAATMAAPFEHLDFATMVKASQAVSGEVELEKLIDALMRLAIEHAGAERGLLLLSRGNELRQEAEAMTNGDGIIVRRRDASAAAVPDSIVHYVMRTREGVLLDNASLHSTYSLDPYVRGRNARSVLCLPLVNDSKLIGVLYLENNLTPHVFTPDRVTRLKVLVSQAAISLENSRLYRDLADREGAVRESEGRFRDYAETASDWLWEIGPDFKFTLLTENAFGSDPAGRIGTVYWDHALDLETEPEKWRLVRDTLDSRKPFRNFVYCVAGSNGPLYVKASGKPVFDSSGEFRGYRGTGTDVTAITRAEEALRESERSLRSAIDGIPGLVAILDPNGDIEAINRQIVEYCGRPLQELKSWGTNGIIHDKELPHLVEVFGRSIASGVPYEVEARLRRFDGEYRWFDIRGIPVRDDSGRIGRWYVLLTDIEDRTQALTRLQQMQSDFAHINRVSTMGELAASLSHEILHPIATARNNARAGLRFLAMKPPNLDEAREAIACVVRDVDRANDIVGRIRNHIKKAPPRRDAFDLNEAVREAILMVRSVIARTGVAVHTQLTDELVPVQGDRVQLQQVIVNLILNAVDSMSSDENGARQLSIGIEQGRADGGVLVQVRDSGPGIDPRHVERIFEPFYTTKISGVGMGLSICRSIINGHGGRLWAEANEPRGAVLQFTLPPSREGS
ncbi:MAG: AAA family ATPase [Xanthobacteraceae bacterium]